MKRKWRYEDSLPKTRLKFSRLDVATLLKHSVEELMKTEKEEGEFISVDIIDRETCLDVVKYRSVEQGDVTVRFHLDKKSSTCSKLQVFLGNQCFVEEFFIDPQRMDRMVPRVFDDFLYSNVTYCPLQLASDFMSIKNEITRIKSERKSSGEEITGESRVVPDGTKIAYGARKNILGTFHYFSDVARIKIEGCYGVVIGREKWCGVCVKNRERLDKYPITIKFESLREKKEIEVINLISEAFLKKKLRTDMKLYRTICEMIGLAMRNNYTKKAMDFEHLTRIRINHEINGSDGILQGRFEDGGDGVDVWNGNFILPGKKPIERILDYFRYFPGAQNTTNEVTKVLFESVPFNKSYTKICFDWLILRKGGSRKKMRGMRFIRGATDYGEYSQRHILLKKKLHKCYDQSTNVEHKTRLKKSLDSFSHIENMQKLKLQKAKKMMVFCICSQTSVPGKDSPTLIKVPSNYYFEHSVSHKEARFTITSTILSLEVFRREQIQKGNDKFSNLAIDSLCSDTEPGAIKVLRDDGIMFDFQESFELPFILRLPMPDVCLEGEDAPVMDLHYFSDGDHMMKDFSYVLLHSDGYEGGKCSLFLCGPDEDGSYKLKPLTHRPWVALFEYETTDIDSVTLSQLDRKTMFPSQSEKMKTRLARRKLGKATMYAMEAFKDVYMEGKIYQVDDSRVSMDEIDCGICYMKRVNTIDDLQLQRFTLDPSQIHVIDSELKFWIGYYKIVSDVVAKTKGLSMKTCMISGAGGGLVLRIIKNLRALKSCHRKRDGVLVPYAVCSDNEAEGLFRDTRIDKARNLNPSCADIIDRLPRILLKQQDVVFSRIRSSAYEYSERITLNECLLSKKCILDFKKLRERDIEALQKHLTQLCEVVMESLGEEELDSNRKELVTLVYERFSYVAGYVLSSSNKTCRSTNRKKLSKMFLCFSRKTRNFRSTTTPVKDFVSLLWDIDCFLRKNLHRFLCSKNFVVMEEIFFKKVLAYKDDEEMNKNCFEVVVSTFVAVRVQEIMNNRGMSEDKYERHFRGTLK